LFEKALQRRILVLLGRRACSDGDRYCLDCDVNSGT